MWWLNDCLTWHQKYVVYSLDVERILVWVQRPSIHKLLTMCTEQILIFILCPVADNSALKCLYLADRLINFVCLWHTTAREENTNTLNWTVCVCMVQRTRSCSAAWKFAHWKRYAASKCVSHRQRFAEPHSISLYRTNFIKIYNGKLFFFVFFSSELLRHRVMNKSLY